MRRNRATLQIGPTVLLVSLLATSSVLAEEIPWLTDYAQARHEALAWNRPLLISFGSKTCVACRQIEETILRDPIHAGIISREFVCLRVEADKDDYLVKHLKIQVLPTLVFASPAGVIVHRVQGAQDMKQFTGHIDEALRTIRQEEDAKRLAASANQRTPAGTSPYAPAGAVGAGYGYGQASPGLSAHTPRFFTTNYFIPTEPISC